MRFAEKLKGGGVGTNSAAFDVVADSAVGAVEVALKLADKDKDLKKMMLVPEEVELHCWLDR